MVQDLDFFFKKKITMAQDLYNFFQNNNSSPMAQDFDFFYFFKFGALP